MTRYDWSKLDAGWRHEPRSETVRAKALVHNARYPFSEWHFPIEELESSAEPKGLHTLRWARLYPEARAQLAKCRILDTDPEESSERATPTNAELMAQLERMQADVETMRTELAAMRNPTDERDWQALTEENERLRERIRNLEVSQRDWRELKERLKKLGWKEAE